MKPNRKENMFFFQYRDTDDTVVTSMKCYTYMDTPLNNHRSISSQVSDMILYLGEKENKRIRSNMGMDTKLT